MEKLIEKLDKILELLSEIYKELGKVETKDEEIRPPKPPANG